MKTSNYFFVSSICALIVGVLLIVNPGDAVSFLVIAIGALFLLPGVVGTFSWLRAVTKKKTEVTDSPSIMVLIVSVGSLLLGLWLMIMPQFFIGALMYVLGVLLVLCGVNQLTSLIVARRSMKVPFVLFVFPIVFLLTGILILYNPFEAANVPFIILGVAFLVYGVTDLVRLFSYKGGEKRNISDAEVVEEVKDDAPTDSLPSTNA